MSSSSKKAAGQKAREAQAEASTEAPQTRERSKVTINDVARIAKVSKKTVSRVINLSPRVKVETRAHVEAVIRDLGFLPDPQARGLALRRSFLIGLIYDNPSPQYVVNMQHGVLDAIEGTNYQLVLRPCDRGDPNYLQKIDAFVAQNKPFGVILPPSVSEDERVVELLRARDCDYVRIASVDLDEPERSVRTHDAEGGAQAARHLASLGHELIAHIHGPKTFRSSHERLGGFRSALEDAGLKLEKDMTIEGAYTFDSGVRCTERLLYGKRRPTAIFAGNDEMAVGAYLAARKAGLRIPDDISIMGYDDTPIAGRMWPALTTVRMPIHDLGLAACKLLLARSFEERQTERIIFLPEIVVRESTAPPPKA